jgi:hypothetical protein
MEAVFKLPCIVTIYQHVHIYGHIKKRATTKKCKYALGPNVDCFEGRKGTNPKNNKKDDKS